MCGPAGIPRKEREPIHPRPTKVGSGFSRSKKDKRLEEAYPELEGLADRNGFLISVSEDEETQFICIEPENPDHPSLYIDLLSNKIEAEVGAKQIPIDRLPGEYRPFIEVAEKYLIAPEEISSNALASMDQAIRNIKLGQVLNPADFSDF